jgi:hypothetical protein
MRGNAQIFASPLSGTYYSINCSSDGIEPSSHGRATGHDMKTNNKRLRGNARGTAHDR